MLLEGGPGPQLVFPGEEVKWGNNMGEIGDKFAIEVREPEEWSNTFDGDRGFPFFNGGKFDRVQLNLSLANDHSKEFNAQDVKGAFGEFKRQPMFSKAK